MAIMIGSKFLFGNINPAPQIHGYDVHLACDYWVIAERDGRQFYVEGWPDHYQLIERKCNGAHRTKKNPEGFYADTSRPIRVDK